LTPFIVRKQLVRRLAAAMDFVSNTDALIFDLRTNDGGRADAVALLVSYFVEGNPQQLVGIYWKPLPKTVESFTSPSIKGRKYLDRKYTFSPARIPSLPPRGSAIT
jgi:hypothetical protein